MIGLLAIAFLLKQIIVSVGLRNEIPTEIYQTKNMLMTSGYYLIKPTDALKNKLTLLNFEPDLLEIMFQVQLWQHNRVSRLDESEGDIAEIKLLFLANIKSIYLDANLYQKIFDDNRISLEISIGGGE